MDESPTTPSTDTTAESSQSQTHRIRIGDRDIDYVATAGTVLVRDAEHEPLASVFYLSYVAEQPVGAPARPVTFFFNGGPGSASLWLNIGGFGPKRAPTATPAATPPAPYIVGDNPHSLIDTTDMVFIDAVGTGYSRLAGSATGADVWGVDQDVDVFARAITRYLTITNNWNAPRFLFGESYGTTRSAALVHKLQNQGIDFNGVVLLSTLLNWTTMQAGADQSYVNSLPSFAAAAWYHKRRDDHPDNLDAYLDEVRAFAQGPYAAALQLGDRLPAEQENAVAEQLGRHIGLDAGYLKRTMLRVDMEQFRRALLDEQGIVIGRFDTRFTAENNYIIGNGSHDPATDDAATAGVNSAHLSTFRDHLVSDIGYTSELHYLPLNNVVIAQAWDWNHKAPGFDAPMQIPNVTLDLAAALRRNRSLRVAVMGGVYDLATPFFGAEYDFAHMFLSAELRENVSFHFYESGHMTFVDEVAITKMKADLIEFYATATRTA
ncbi:carboxypeptidase [Leifsonia kafniensis]|uniref:Carboxypeptidase n=1 Tax=Leifsonia kafniensis TaxID=475957 RepID=A0ABP7KFV1_9MICO